VVAYGREYFFTKSGVGSVIPVSMVFRGLMKALIFLSSDVA